MDNKKITKFICENCIPERHPLLFKNKDLFLKEMTFLFENPTAMKDLFSVYHEGVRNGKSNKINSFVAYLLGITDIWNEGSDFKYKLDYKLTRLAPPDIDVDFEDREPVFKHILNKYGSDKTGFISTYQIIKAKSAVQYAFKVEGIEDNGMNADQFSIFMSKKVNPRAETFEEAISKYDLKPWVDKYPQVFEVARQIHGLQLYCGKHPAGIIVADKSLEEYVPIRRVGEEFVIEYDKDDVENIGLLKNDILGLVTLKHINQCIKVIEEDTGDKIVLEEIDINDQDVIDAIFRDMDAGGVFQFEKQEMYEVLKPVRPSSFAEVVACNALVRPGPKTADYHHMYGERKRDPSKVTYYHPSLEPILKETYGLILYQEQVMKMTRILAGFSATQADKIRKFIGKKQNDPAKVKEIQDMWLKGCEKMGLIDGRTAQKLWEIMVEFGKYAFNKSHSVAYAILSMWTAYLKHYYYPQFMSSWLTITLDHLPDFDIKLQRYYKEMKKRGYRVKSPDINLSKDRFYVLEDKKTIIEPFHINKGIGKNVGSQMSTFQPFSSFDDFLAKLSKSPLGSDVIDIFFDQGYFKSLMGMENLQSLRDKYHAWSYIRKKEKSVSKTRMGRIPVQTNLPGVGRLRNVEVLKERQGPSQQSII